MRPVATAGEDEDDGGWGRGLNHCWSDVSFGVPGALLDELLPALLLPPGDVLERDDAEKTGVSAVLVDGETAVRVAGDSGVLGVVGCWVVVPVPALDVTTVCREGLSGSVNMRLAGGGPTDAPATTAALCVGAPSAPVLAGAAAAAEVAADESTAMFSLSSWNRAVRLGVTFTKLSMDAVRMHLSRDGVTCPGSLLALPAAAATVPSQAVGATTGSGGAVRRQ